MLTGSTNWTMTGLCTQANNGLVIDDAAVADAYLQEWERLHEAGNGFPSSLVAANSQAKVFDIDGGRLNLWFAPTGEAEDLQQARRLINRAKEGILFLFFNPGPFQEEPNRWTLLQSVLNRHHAQNNPYYQENLYIRRVVNQQIPSLTEPGPAAAAAPTGAPNAARARKPAAHDHTRPGQGTGGSAAAHQLDPAAATEPVSLFSRGDVAPTRLNKDVLVPANIRANYANIWDTELKGASMVMVHSKVVVLDPFGDSPVVMTGSHNLGPKASVKNDDNLVIIEGNGPLAAAYAVNIIAIYDQYRWRSYVTNQQAAPAPGKKAFAGLEDDDTWQQGHLSGDSLGEIEFFLHGAGGPAGAAVPVVPPAGSAIRAVTSHPAKRGDARTRLTQNPADPDAALPERGRRPWEPTNRAAGALAATFRPDGSERIRRPMFRGGANFRSASGRLLVGVGVGAPEPAQAGPQPVCHAAVVRQRRRDPGGGDRGSRRRRGGSGWRHGRRLPELDGEAIVRFASTRWRFPSNRHWLTG